VFSVCYAPSGAYICSGSVNGAVDVWDAQVESMPS
jgi:hypothetical protein